MFLTLLSQKVVAPIGIDLTPKKITVLPDTLRAQTASYRIRELIYQSSKTEDNIALVYKDTLRAIKRLFSTFSILDSEELIRNVQCITANPERAIAKLNQEDNLILPIISVAQPTTGVGENRQKYHPMIISESIWDDRTQRAKRVVSLAPKPVDITYKITILSKYKKDIDQLSEQIYLVFNPSHELQTTYSNNTKVILEKEEDESSVEAADKEDRILMKSFTLKVETYIPMPKFIFSSTGKLERFYTETIAIDTLPVTEPTEATSEIFAKDIEGSLPTKELVSDTKSASYRIRELIFASENAETNISHVYKETLRSIQHLFSGYKIINSDDSTLSVKCIYANPERAIAKVNQENNLILPIISVSQPNAEIKAEKQKFLPMIVSESIWNDKKQKAQRIVSLVSKPIDITYKVVVFSKYKNDLDQLSEQIYQTFNPTCDLLTSISNNTKARLVEESTESTLEAADKEDRILMKAFSIVVETYIPSPKFIFSSTGKIEKFYTETELVKNIPASEEDILQTDVLEINGVYKKPENLLEELPFEATASYRIRELIAKASEPENNISFVYKDTLRAILKLFSGLNVINSEEELELIKCIYANPERAIAKLNQEDNLILPIISVSQPTTNINQEKQKYVPMIVSESIWDDRAQRARRIVSLAPKPVDITYKVTILSKYKSDLDQITEQIYLLFNPSCDLVTSFANNTKAILTEELNESTVETADKEDRILMRSFTVKVETYIPNPKFVFSSTGEIERFYYNVEVSEEI